MDRIKLTNHLAGALPNKVISQGKKLAVFCVAPAAKNSQFFLVSAFTDVLGLANHHARWFVCGEGK